MKEFTLRNKAKNPIMTLTPAMMDKMLMSRPESVSLVLAKRIKDYKSLTDKNLSIDYEQQQILLQHAGADEKGTWTSKYSSLPYPLSQVKPVFADGFMLRSLSGDMVDDLALAESFYDLLDTQLDNKK